MKNYGFEVRLNDTYLCRAGFESNYHVVTCIVDSVRRESDSSEDLSLSISGLNSQTEENVKWVYRELKEGDKISIDIIADNFDKPSASKKNASKEELLQSKIAYYKRLKAELKDYLQE